MAQDAQQPKEPAPPAGEEMRRGPAGRQDGPPDGQRRGDRGERGDREGRGDRRFDPEQMRARMAEYMKGALKANDEEWTVIEPLLTDVVEKQRDARGGAFGMFRGRRGEDEADGSATTSLRTALESEETSADDIKAKLAAVREERKGKEKELEAARGKLRAVLTVRQEAQLVMMGILD